MRYDPIGYICSDILPENGERITRVTGIGLFYIVRRSKIGNVVVRLIPVDESEYSRKQKAESMNGL